MSKYRAVVVDLMPGVSDDERAANSSEGFGETIDVAEAKALEGSAVNCVRRVYVEETAEPFIVVKGPYIRRPDAD